MKQESSPSAYSTMNWYIVSEDPRLRTIENLTIELRERLGTADKRFLLSLLKFL